MTLITLLLTAFLHDTTGIPVQIVRESELGIYDTTRDTVQTIMEFPDRFTLDGKPYPVPKYRLFYEVRK